MKTGLVPLDPPFEYSDMKTQGCRYSNVQEGGEMIMGMYIGVIMYMTMNKVLFRI